MKRWAPWLAAAVGGAVVVHLAVIHAIPWMIMAVVMRTASSLAGVNTPSFPGRADENARAIVRPSPDLLYSTCVFDLSERPMRFTAKVPEGTYWSLSMFAANTDNFYKVNDREAEGGKVDIVLAPAGATVEVPPGAVLVEAPTVRGIALTRTLISDEGRLAEIDAARRQFACAPM